MTRKKSPPRTGTRRALKAAEGLFASLCADLDRERARLAEATETGDAERPRAVAALARETQKALRTLLELELRLMREGETAPGAGAGTMDLGAARDEIEGRLARLAP
jgi:hypothetical protein